MKNYSSNSVRSKEEKSLPPVTTVPSVAVDAAEIERFITIIHEAAVRAYRESVGLRYLRLKFIDPLDDSIKSSDANLYPVGYGAAGMVLDARKAAQAGWNVYVEARSVDSRRKGLKDANATTGVWAFAVDADFDKGKGGVPLALTPSMMVETSPGNHHAWYFLKDALEADEAQPIGRSLRAGAGADSATGVLTQPYRVAGTPNFPGPRKRERGRLETQATRILSTNGPVYSADELRAAYPPIREKIAASIPTGRSGKTSLAFEELATERTDDRSAQFQKAVNAAARDGLTPDDAAEVFRRYPHGCAEKFLSEGRLESEIERSFSKLDEPLGSGGSGFDLMTEDAAARLFAEQNAGSLRYCHSQDAWFECDPGVRWKKDETGKVPHRAREFARQLGVASLSKATIAKVGKAAFSANVAKLAGNDPSLAVTAEAWDADPWVLGTPGGVVDLRTGAMRPAMPDEGITRLTSVAPTATADCPTWLRFLDQATGGDPDMVRFLQQWAGYCLTGSTREHALVFIYGPGGNGKGRLIKALEGIMGEYAKTAGMEVFMSAQFDRHSNEIASLCGARLVTASETEEQRQWAEVRIKSLTGGDTVTARFLYQQNFQFDPTFKLLFTGNNAPGLNKVDEAARRRFNLVPFNHKPAIPDQQLDEKLKAEWPGILRWAIEGCLDWQRNGLLRPARVKQASEAYFATQDVFGEWLETACYVDPDSGAGDKPQILFTSCCAYLESQGERKINSRVFAERMRGKGFEASKYNGERRYKGVLLRGEGREQREMPLDDCPF